MAMEDLPGPFPLNYYIGISCPGEDHHTWKLQASNTTSSGFVSRFHQNFSEVERKPVEQCCHPALVNLVKNGALKNAYKMHQIDAMSRHDNEFYTFREFGCRVILGHEYSMLERLRDTMLREAQMMALLDQSIENLWSIQGGWLEQEYVGALAAVSSKGAVPVHHLYNHDPGQQGAPFLAMVPAFFEFSDSDSSESESSDGEDGSRPFVSTAIAEPKMTPPNRPPSAHAASQSTSTTHHHVVQLTSYIQMPSHCDLDTFLAIRQRNPCPSWDDRRLEDLVLSVAGQLAAQLAAVHAAGLVHLHLCPHNVLVANPAAHTLAAAAAAEAAAGGAAWGRGGVRVGLGGLAFLSRPGHHAQGPEQLAPAPAAAAADGGGGGGGCAAFRAPEQRENERCDAQADAWALGAVARRLLRWAAGAGAAAAAAAGAAGAAPPRRAMGEGNEEEEEEEEELRARFPRAAALAAGLTRGETWDRMECFEVAGWLEERGEAPP